MIQQSDSEVEMIEYLEYEKNSNDSGENGENNRNKHADKTILLENQETTIKIPRNCNGTFESVIVPKHQKRLSVFNDQIISMYSLRTSSRDIKVQLEKIYNDDISPNLMSYVGNIALEEVNEWQNRPLEKSYAIVYFYTLDVIGCKKSVCIVMGINMAGRIEVLGLWIDKNECTKFWIKVLNELKNRGVKDILIACMGDLSGFSDAVRSVFPDTHVQLCIFCMVRNSTKLVSFKDLNEVSINLKTVYSANSALAARDALEEFGKKWNHKYLMIYESWNHHLEDLNEFFKYPIEIRRAIYSTSVVESLNYQLWKVTENRSVFSTDDAIMLKVIYLVIRNTSMEWTMPIMDWEQVLNQFAIEFGKERVPFK